MKHLFLFLLLLSVYTPSFGQVESLSNISFNGNTFNAFVVKVEPETLKKFDVLINDTGVSHQDFISGLSDTTCFLINASISDPNCKPLGLFVKNGLTLQGPNFKDGVGNFYLKPNGALLITASDAIICESSQISTVPNVELGIQSGPMLLVNGVVNPQFNPNSTNKQVRCGTGIFTNTKNEKFIVFAISNEPVSFYDFTLFFSQKFKCNVALCLESAGCAMFFPNQESPNRDFNNMICNYLYFKI
ncbi:phosphodiester glycosidase family protein [Rufibacter roseolus]|uniref:phosphodiester glycosidase family protein n=1 Tax=Rufibacter roseolus TaxID=2817375 RepID=UPI001B30B4B0|nr:phosphodiester glycosidase family protein [Rufibacter roseolus]